MTYKLGVPQVHLKEEGTTKATPRPMQALQEIPTLHISYLFTMGFAKQIELKTVW